MNTLNLRQYESLGPFEIKNELAALAQQAGAQLGVSYLNAGRGNPNWVALEPRDAYFLLGQFAVSECRRVIDLPPGLGGMAKMPGIASRLSDWVTAHADLPGAAVLGAMVPWAVAKFGFDADAFVHELVDSIIGDNYPTPDRMLVHNEQIVREYLQWAMCGSPRPEGTYELYAVEGGTAAMCYIFKSLKTNRILNAGDTIALGTPIFTPYLEMPHLEDYDLKVVHVEAHQDDRFQFTDRELAKLLDPKVKAFFLCNPGNPSAVALNAASIANIGKVLEKRPDLILLTDDVYGTFVPGFRSLLAAFPRNTIGVYSYSKYFGCTGWRLGVIALHENHLLDELIAKHPKKVLKALDKRYGTLVLEPRKIKFIDRIVADSRDVALNHTAGLSLPQQVMMSLFSLYELMDEKKLYQRACMSIVKKRVEATIAGLGIEVAPNEMFDYYYGVIDFEFWLKKYAGGAEVFAWIRRNVHPLDIVFRLARDYGIVLLNGGGFEAPDWSVRVSFANLEGYVYDDIGRAVREIALVYRDAYKAALAAGEKAARKKTAAKSAGRVKSGKAAKPAKPAKTAKSVQAAKSPKTVKTAKPAKKSKPAKKTKSDDVRKAAKTSSRAKDRKSSTSKTAGKSKKRSVKK
jgi:aspartate 4-decarboxylase